MIALTLLFVSINKYKKYKDEDVVSKKRGEEAAEMGPDAVERAKGLRKREVQTLPKTAKLVSN